MHPKIRHLVHLTRLHLPFNQLANLPETLSDLRELQVSYYSCICLHTTIYLAYYYISHTDARLPARIANKSLLCELQILILLYMCPQTGISHMLMLSDLLCDLQILNLVENSFETIGEHICKITSLTELRVSHNKLKDLSPSIKLLQGLKRLNLECNELSSLPQEFGGMSSLTHLNLNTNQV